MATLVTAYVVAAAAVSAYAARIVIGTGRVLRRLRQLQSHMDCNTVSMPAKRIA
jgi:hypothetical protein